MYDKMDKKDKENADIANMLSDKLSLKIAAVIENFECPIKFFPATIRLTLLKIAGFVFYELGANDKISIKEDIDLFFENLLAIGEQMKKLEEKENEHGRNQ
jgi:hypothetical protein